MSTNYKLILVGLILGLGPYQSLGEPDVPIESSGDEIDYSEPMPAPSASPGAGAQPSAAASPKVKKKKKRRRRYVRERPVQGSSALNRFQADTFIKSYYKQNGRALDVDPD